MIKIRVLGEDWDDVIHRALQKKLGLGELYEEKYLKKSMRLHVEDEEK